MADPMEAQQKNSISGSCYNLMDLPEALITRILCFLAPKHIPSAIRTCSYWNNLINSPDFLKDYQLCRHKSGCIVTDNFGSDCPHPHLYIYDIISHQWNTIVLSKIFPAMLNPRMLSASGGLVLFMVNKRTNTESRRGLLQQSKELVVVKPLGKQSKKLPDFSFISYPETSNACCVEVVADDMGSSYKVILFMPILRKDAFWVYKSGTQTWKHVAIPDAGIPQGNMNSIVSRRSVLYRGVLYWLIATHMDGSYLFFYDTRCDALRRPTLCFSRGVTASLYGIAVCGGNVIRVFKDESRGESKLWASQLNEENNDDWFPLFESSVPDMGRGVFCETGRGVALCSNGEEENVFWMVCLVSKEKEIYGHKMLGRHMWLLACNLRDGNWLQLSPCSTGECDDKYKSGVTQGIFHRPLSQAKWMNFGFSGPIDQVQTELHP